MVKSTMSRRLTKEELMALLNTWVSQYRDIDSVYTLLHDLFQIAPESKVATTLYDTHRKYTLLLEKYLEERFPNASAWLEWFLWDNKCGRSGSEAKLSTWKKYKKIETIKDLASLYLDSD